MWTIIESVASAGTLLTALIGLPIALSSFRKTRTLRKTTFLDKYLNEYRSAKMGRAIAALHSMYKCAGRDELKLIRRYIECSKADGMSFHFNVRRKVSAFYQQMAFFAEADREIKDILFRVWGRGDLQIIRDIILL